MSPELIAMHMGALHPYETVLTLLLAFGPFLVLGMVVAMRRSEHVVEPAADADDRESELLGDRSA